MISYFTARGETRRLDDAARAKLRGSFAALSDGITHYELRGAAGGELVLLVPGLTIPLFYWDGLAAELHKRGYRTLAYSAYGRGYSDRVRATYDSDLFLRQLVELTETLRLTGPHHVVGASMGGLIAMALVRQRPSSARSLTLIGPAGLERRPPFIARLLRRDSLAVAFGQRVGQRLLRAHLAREVRSSEHAEVLSDMVTEAYTYEGSIYALFATIQRFPLISQHELYRNVGRSGVPIHLLWGGGDVVTPTDHFDQARALLRPADSFVFDDCGHMPPFERPVATAERMAHFFSKLPTRPRIATSST